MALVVVLFPTSDEPILRPAALDQLSRLGVTNIVLLREGATTGLVLEGWAFDPDRSSEAACAVAGGAQRRPDTSPAHADGRLDHGGRMTSPRRRTTCSSDYSRLV